MSGDEYRTVVALGDDQLDEIARRGVATPRYDRGRLRPRIAHIGVGGFHRAHLAIYCDSLAADGGTWGICGIGLLPSDRAMADALAAQDHLYVFTEKGGDRRTSAVIGSIIDYVLAVDDREPAIARLADPSTAIVSMTITEAGYDDSSRNRATFDVVAAALGRRRTNGDGGVTILSCDNLPGNGDAAKACVLAACDRLDPTLAAWTAAGCTFPNSMVDRITPVTGDDDRDHLVERYGLVDRWPVVGEPFRQWVLEDDFAAGRPDFERVGVLYTDDVRAWELYKLRLLNAGHSAIAYLSALAGITYVDEALSDPTMRTFLRDLLLREAVPTLTPIPGHPREDYATTVIERFANIGVRDQIARLCIDGTSKFPTFLMPTVAGQLELGGPVERSAHALAGWAHYLATVPPADQAADAMADTTRPLAVVALTDPAAFLTGNPAIPPDIAADDRFVDAFVAAHRAIADDGPLGAIARLAR